MYFRLKVVFAYFFRSCLFVFVFTLLSPFIFFGTVVAFWTCTFYFQIWSRAQFAVAYEYEYLVAIILL